MNFLPKVNVRIEKNLACEALELISQLKLSPKKICFITDEKIWQNCEQFFANNFLQKVAGTLILKNARPDEKNLHKIEKFLCNMPRSLEQQDLEQETKLSAVKKQKPHAANYDLIIALGSGVINDLCKFSSHKSGVPYIIFASAPSMNGYLSRNASLLVGGHKKTLAATLPLAVFADLEILKCAPKKLIQAGIGDSLCFYSCWFDWLLSHLILGTKFNEKPFAILHNKMNFFVKNYAKFKLNDEKLLKILMEILLLSGAGMTMAGGSYPASQSEHLIAHAFEMKYSQKAHKILHGLQIAITTLATAKMQENLVVQYVVQNKNQSATLLAIPQIFIEKFPQKNFFNAKITAECKKEYFAKINIDVEKINNRLQLEWVRHQKVLQKILLPEKNLRKIFQHFKIKVSEKSLGLSRLEYEELQANAKFIRNRFTCLDLQ